MPANDNHLIDLLPRAAARQLLTQCEQVELVLHDILCEPGEESLHAWFPRSGFISLIAAIDKQPTLEVGMVGREGMLGAHLVLGHPAAPLQALVQGSGTAWRIGSKAFKAELARSPPLQRCLNHYIYVLMAQMASAAACLRLHQIGPRLARWLLMSHDRAQSERFHVTQEFLAYMLGVRRVGVTTAATSLQRKGLIAYRRGEMTVIDRPGLEAAACCCYAADCQTYERVLG